MSTKLKKPKRRKPRRLRGTLGDRVDVFLAKTGISRPTAYRMMASGKLKYAQVGERIRLIPITEYVRLGLVADDAATAV
jgi:excisionase family DNA binding protein